MQEQDPGMTEDQNTEGKELEDKRGKLKWYTVVESIGCGVFVIALICSLLVGIWQTCKNPPTMENKRVDFTTTAWQIGTKYDRNAVGAESKYKGKIVVVSERIEDIGLKGPRFWRSPYLTLRGGAGVICRFPVGEGSMSDFYELSKGQWVTIKGKVGEAEDGVAIIESCVFVKSKG